MLSSPVSLRRRWARLFKMVGPYVSGMKMKSGHVTPARMAPIQKLQLQETTEMKPATRGPRIGPNVVAAFTVLLQGHNVCGPVSSLP
jgi:hypothetical protein